MNHTHRLDKSDFHSGVTTFIIIAVDMMECFSFVEFAGNYIGKWTLYPDIYIMEN